MKSALRNKKDPEPISLWGQRQRKVPDRPLWQQLHLWALPWKTVSFCRPVVERYLYGVTAQSVINLRYGPGYSFESATQTLMGTPLQVLEKRNGWTRVKTPEGYIAWVTSPSVKEMDKEAFEAWAAAEKLLVNKHYTLFREAPLPGAPVVSDGVWGNIVELKGLTPLYYKVQLPNGKEAYLSRHDAEPFQKWALAANPMAEDIIATALQFMGFPYMWAGTSIKAMDCSGLVSGILYK